MKRFFKIVIVAAVFVCLAMFGGCESVKAMSSLRAFSKPFAGQYECVEAQFGGKDLMEQFREILLTLQNDGKYELYAVPKKGKAFTDSGKYEYDDANKKLTLYLVQGLKTYRLECIVKDGKFTVSHTFAGKTLILKFKTVF